MAERESKSIAAVQRRYVKALKERHDAYRTALERIEYITRKASLCDAERAEEANALARKVLEDAP